MTTHYYLTSIEWTGNTGSGTSAYSSYERHYTIDRPGTDKPRIVGSSDPAFRGDPARWNPEELLVASISACHQLWYLNLCAAAGVVVTAYTDRAEGTMVETAEGGGQFSAVVLHPVVTIAAGSDAERALSMHAEAHRRCFIANSVNFPVTHVPMVIRTDSNTTL